MSVLTQALPLCKHTPHTARAHMGQKIIPLSHIRGRRNAMLELAYIMKSCDWSHFADTDKQDGVMTVLETAY